MRNRALASLLVLPMFLSGCVVTTTTRTATWGDPSGPRERYGRVQSIQEFVERTEGQPAAGAVAGALIGGVLGSAIGGHRHVDRYGRVHHHGNGAAALAGAAAGAVVGAAASSQPATERRFYDVRVVFEDGGVATFRYLGSAPFRVGDAVVLGPNGLELEQ